MGHLISSSINSVLEEQERLTVKWETSQLPPNKGIALDTLWYKVDEDLHDTRYVLYYAELLVHEKIKLPSREKILSISDNDVAYILTVSINGSKGEKLTLEDWDATSYAVARRKRSAVESSMFTLKYRHGFGRMRRRVIEAEQLEKV